MKLRPAIQAVISRPAMKKSSPVLAKLLEIEPDGQDQHEVDGDDGDIHRGQLNQSGLNEESETRNGSHFTGCP